MDKMIASKRPPELIFTAADHHYIPGALVALYSAAQQHDSAKDYVLVTSDPHSYHLSRTIYQLFESEGATLRVVPTSDLPLSRWNGATLRFPAEAFARYFPDCLGSDASVALYFDSDVLIMPAINEVALDFNADKCIYAFPEYHPIKKGQPFKHHDPIGLDRGETYYQSGALLFDVPRYVASGVRNQLEYTLHQRGDAFMYPDQDAFNIAAREHVGTLSSRLNSSPYFWRILPFKHDELAIVHFLGNLKPWDRQAYKISRDLLDIYDSYAFNLNLRRPIMGPRNEHHYLQQRLYPITFWLENWYRCLRARTRLLPLMQQETAASAKPRPYTQPEKQAEQPIAPATPAPLKSKPALSTSVGNAVPL